MDEIIYYVMGFALGFGSAWALAMYMIFQFLRGYRSEIERQRKERKEQ